MAPASFNFGDHEVRVSVDEGGAVWWVLTDVCKALDLTNASYVAQRLKASEKKVIVINYTLGGPQETLTINEPGLYRLIFTSRKKEAEKFQDWVFHEVLPTIRKTGGYQTQAEKPVTEIETEVVTKYVVKEVEFDSHFTTPFLLEPEKMAWLKSPNEDYRKSFAKSLRRVLLEREDLSEIHINRELKDFVFNRPRKEWTSAHYLLAVAYLRNVYGL